MKTESMVIAAAVAVLLIAGLAGQAAAAVACGAVGEVVENHGGTWTYTITVTWDFNEAAVPERFILVLDELDDCMFFDPENPIQENYIMPGPGTSEAAPGCFDVTGAPSSELVWSGEIRRDDVDCWVPSLHLAYENVGPTADCEAVSAGEAVFTFDSYAMPTDTLPYYDAIVIKAGPYCIVCDYTGPLPGCNDWNSVQEMHWGTIKAIYR